MHRVLLVPVLVAAAAASASAQFGAPRSTDYSKSLAPYVVSPQPVVDAMLEAARIKPGETVYDLGCGDGRILITAVEKFHAKAVGVELNPRLASLASDSLKRRNMDNQARVIHANMLEVDLSPADVVTLYLLTDSNDVIKPRLEQFLKPGARVVSHEFKVRGWEPVRTEKVQVLNRPHTIYVYEMPAKK